MYIEKVAASQASMLTAGTVSPHRNNAGVKHVSNPTLLAEHFRKKKLTKTNVKELLEGKETLVKGIKNKEKKPYNAVVKIGEKGYIDFISFSK